jgi:protein gp37
VPIRWLDEWPRNAWLGVTAENQEWADLRIPILLRIPVRTRFVSYEPALGPVDFGSWLLGCLHYQNSGKPHASQVCILSARRVRAGLDWIIVGGESGSQRAFDIAWARSAVSQCKAVGVPVFVKQLGARPFSERSGFLRFVDIKGSTIEEWPHDLRVREFPGSPS